jgi:ubiquinone/menaquinone biosynthesis C-methylase UbiE
MVDDPDAPDDGDAARPTADSRASVRATYDRIGEHFAKTRANPWPEVEAFLAGRSGDVGVDVGCGNGRHTELLAERCDRTIGLDASRALLAVAADRPGPDGNEAPPYALVQGDAATLPVVADCVDLAVYVATVHHLPTRAGRVASLDELARVLAPGGRALVSAWSTTHDRFDADSGFDTTVDWTLPGGDTVDRFYHIYDPTEFESDVAESALEPASFEVSSGNCYAVVGIET